MNSINVIDYMLTSACNLHCPFCYGPDNSKKDKELEFFLIKKILSFFRDNGINSIVFSGGEPLLYSGIKSVIDYSKKLNFNIALQTNACFDPSIINGWIKNLSWLCMPIDSIKPENNYILRTTKDHYKYVILNIKNAKKYQYNSLKIKIGTVVTQYNIKELYEIAELISIVKPDVWKWYQVRPRGSGLYNFRKLIVSSCKMKEVEGDIRKKYPNINLIVSFSSDTNKAYLIIDPDSEILIPEYDNYLSFGKLINNAKEINTLSWNQAVSFLDQKKYVENIKRTFPVNF